MIMTYYSVIGGWITEYLAVYLAGQGVYAAEEGYFTSFITAEVYPIIFMLLFLAITAFIVYSGVEKGIERFARIVMPGLLIKIVGIAVYSLTLHFKDGNGSIRTGIQGLMIILAVYVVPVMMAVLFLQSAGIFTLVRQCN